MRGAISIHAPHEGERRTNSALCCSILLFQSTLPTRGSDFIHPTASPDFSQISIHAPHEGERPPQKITALTDAADFNPRSPRGGATGGKRAIKTAIAHFNPRSPRGGATPDGYTKRTRTRHFNPRSPRGGATIYNVNFPRQQHISIHAPHEGERRLSALRS